MMTETQKKKSAKRHALESHIEGSAKNVVLKEYASKAAGIVAYAS